MEMRSSNMRSIYGSLVGALLVALPFLVSPPAAHAQQMAGLDIHRSRTTGLASFVTAGDGGVIPVTPPAGVAQAGVDPFFVQYGSLFGVKDAAHELMAVRSMTDALGHTHDSYEQVHKGVPVFSGILKVHRNAFDQVIAANGDFYPIPDKLSVVPSLSADEAALIATKLIASDVPTAEVIELTIVDPAWYGDRASGTHLAYYLILSDPVAMVRDAFFVDAHSGTVLDQWSVLPTARFREIYDGGGLSALPGTLARSEGDAPVADTDTNRAYDYGGDVYDYYSRAFGRDSIDDNGMTLIITVHTGAMSCPNAGWTGQQMIFCTGTVTDDITAHEITHGVTERTAGLIYQNQPGQLNESYSDIFGEMIDLYNGDASIAGTPGGSPSWPTHPTGAGQDTPNNARSACSPPSSYPDGVRWLMGEDASAFGGAIRDMWDPTCFGDPDRGNSGLQTCPAGDAGGVHSGSGIPNHAFAMMVDGKSFNGFTVSAIGPIKAGAVWYRALTVYLTPASDFEDAYVAINQASTDLIGTTPNDPRTGAASASAFTAGDATQVDNALQAVEMNSVGACGAWTNLFNAADPTLCSPLSSVFFEDFESGAAGWTVSNSSPPTAYDWVLDPMPPGRQSTVMFGADPNIGSCSGSPDESGLHSLFSPTLAMPGGLTQAKMSFKHLLATESGWDGGNVSVSVNGGAWQLIGSAAFTYNPYNLTLNGGSPLAGQEAFSGADGHWVTSVVDLSGFVSPSDNLQLRFDIGKDLCAGEMGWWVDDVSVYDCTSFAPTGGCCVGATCTIETQADCTTLLGTYLGDGSDCLGTPGSTTVYTSTPNVTIPDGGGAGNPATDTINVPGSVTIDDVDIDVAINHTWVGDLTVQITHGATTVTIIDRPGYTGSGFGCSLDNYDIILDDEGTGGTIESACQNNLSSPPNYTPNDALSAFDGADAAGDWIITVYDSVSADGGTLVSWSVHVTEATSSCTGCTSDPQCDDGLFCNGAETCVTGACQAGTPPNLDDGVGCTVDTCDEATDTILHTPSAALCDNGLFCDGAETCDIALDCQGGAAPNLDDGVGCTVDSCDEATDTILHTPSAALCDNGLFCDGAETCDIALDCQGGAAPNLDDGVGCTVDSCDEAADTILHTPSAALCDNGLFCDGAETCDIALDCQGGAAPNLDDGVGCTVDSCDEATDTILHTPSAALCDNGLFCDGAETCDIALDCQGGAAPNLDDGVGCTVDSCDEATDTILHTPSAALCDNGLFCDGAETCDIALDCQGGAAPNLDDGVGCTVDSCDEATDTILHTPSAALCDNGLFCDGAETCDIALDCQGGAAPNLDDGVGCTVDSCDEGIDTVVHTPNDASCNNGQFCDGTETCHATLDCQPGTAIDCNDGISCTDDSCDEVGDACVNAANDALCDNGLFCDGTETCHATLDCQSGTAVDCDDAVGCTDDSCNESTDSCDNVANDANCDNGLFCDGAETCDAVNDCQAGSDPCPGQVCDEGGDACVECVINGDCDDGLFCNGAETCLGNVCQPGTTVDCDDGVGCTDDTCDEVNDMCVNAPNDTLCDNGQFCDGDETCHATLDCQPGTSVDCGDGVGCTEDMCDEVNDICVNAPNDTLCDNAQFCDGDETCDLALDCQGGVAPNLDDGVGCTVDSCDEASNTVIHMPSDALCDDGLFCSGDETCDLTLDCQTAPRGLDDGVSCTVDTCDEVNDTVVHMPTDALCDNGLFCDGDEICDLTLDCQTTPRVLDDGVSCTVDTCDEASSTVVHAPNDATCDNGLFCDGDEICDLTLDCQTTPRVLDDGVGCTVDTCDEATETIIHTPSDAVCDNGQFCDGPETCDAVQDCLSAGDPCQPTETCNESTDSCDQCQFPADCDDGVPCTVDDCIGGACVQTPDDAACDDGSFCTGIETCDAQAGCQIGSNPCTNPLLPACDDVAGCVECTVSGECDDSEECTTDSCTGLACSSTPVANGTPCAGGTGSCANGVCALVPDCTTDSECDDENVCTLDTCNVPSCTNTPRIYGDSNLSGTLGLEDLLCLLGVLQGGDDPSCDSQAMDLSPCTGDGAVGLSDLLDELEALGGADPCGCGL